MPVVESSIGRNYHETCGLPNFQLIIEQCSSVQQKRIRRNKNYFTRQSHGVDTGKFQLSEIHLTRPWKAQTAGALGSNRLLGVITNEKKEKYLVSETLEDLVLLCFASLFRENVTKL